MKILMVCEFFDPALGFQENLLLKYYAKAGHDVTIVTSTYLSVFDYYAGRHDNSVQQSVEEIAGGKVLRLPFRYNILNKLKAYRGFLRVLEEEKPDFIFVHDISLNFPEMVRYLKKNRDVRMIMDYHADYSNSGKNWLSLKILHGTIRKYFLDKARPHLSMIFPIVNAGFDFLHEVYKVPMEEMKLLPLGADTDLVAAVRKTDPRPRIRKRLGIGENEIVIVTGGKLERRKKIELLINAVAALERKDIHIVVAGEFPPDDGDYKELVSSFAKQIPDQVHFVGWLDSTAMFEHMLCADFAVFPASQSVLWLQAIAAGLPLVAGDTGGQDISYVNLYDNVIMLKSDMISQEGICDVIAKLSDDATLRKSMSEGALRVSDEMLDWNKIARRSLLQDDDKVSV